LNTKQAFYQINAEKGDYFLTNAVPNSEHGVHQAFPKKTKATLFGLPSF